MTVEAPLETGTQPAVDQPAADPQTPAVVTEGGANQPATQPSPAALFTADDWREKLSGGDEKVLKQLERYASPDAVAKALVETKRKISAGEFKRPLSSDATPEEVAAWRQENGIPEAPDKYEIKLSDGLVIGDEDKPFVDGFLKIAHEVNATPETVNKLLDWFFDSQDEQIAKAEEADTKFRAEATELLRSEWGADFKTNINLVNGLLDSAPQGLKQNLFEARLADGTVLGNNPEVLKFLAGVAREINPIATVVPGAGAGAATAIADELAKLTKMSGDPNSEYWKGPSAEKNQARMRQLLDAQDRMK